MTGFVANFHSLTIKMPTITAPNRIRQITVADDQGCVTSPKSRPRRIINAPPTMSKLPVQSMALSPARTGVLGAGTFKKKSNTTNTTAPIGTARLVSSGMDIAL
jgi:hypothetical protein